MAKSKQAEAPKPTDAPRFALGARVLLGGEACEVVTVSAHKERLPDGTLSHLYGVRLPAWTRVEKAYTAADGEEITRVFYEHPETKDRRDHAADCLGCVPEAALETA